MNIFWIFIVLDNYFIRVKDFVLKLIISLYYIIGEVLKIFLILIVYKEVVILINIFVRLILRIVIEIRDSLIY